MSSAPLYTNADNEAFNRQLLDNLQHKLKTVSVKEPVSSFSVQHTESKAKTFLTAYGKSGSKFELDDSPLAPLPSSLLSGKKFNTVYEKQINSIVFNNADALDPEKIFALVHLYDVARSSSRPILMTSRAYKKLTPTVCLVLNSFFNQHENVLSGILQMLDGTTALPA